MPDDTAAPPVAVLPPFVLPDQHDVSVSTARLRGRRNLVLLLLPEIGPDAAAYLAAFATHREEWAWLHTSVLIVVPEAAAMSAVASVGVPVLRDGGTVRSALLPGVEANVAALMVADTGGRVAAWRSARRVTSLPDVDTVLTWAWEVTRPRGACDGGVSWARPLTPDTLPPAPIGHLAIGSRRREASPYRSRRRTTMKDGHVANRRESSPVGH